LCAAVQQQERSIVFDLTRVDSVGLGLLISLQAAGIYLTLMNPTKGVREILRVAKLESVFEIREFRPLEKWWTENQPSTCPVPNDGRPVRDLLTHGEQQ
jgi:hypothetical protein